MAKKRKKKLNSNNAKSRFSSRLGNAFGLLLGILLFGTLCAGTFVLMLWVLSLPNWGLFFKWFNINSEMVLDYIKVMIWPVVIVILLIILRSEVKALFHRITSLNIGPGGANFAPPQPDAPSPEQASEIEDVNQTDAAINTSTNDPELENAFDHIFQSILGSQLMALNFIVANGGNSGASQLEFFYKRYYDLLNDPSSAYRTVQAFMNYLVSYNLISYNEALNSYTVLPAGRLFLTYLASKGLTADSRLL